MKKLIYVLSFFIIFQSCYSYKTIDHNNYVAHKREKFKVTTDENKKIEGKIILKNEKEIIISTKESSKKITIPSNQIKKIEKRRVSTVNTLGGVVLSIIGASIILYTGFIIFSNSINLEF